MPTLPEEDSMRTEIDNTSRTLTLALGLWALAVAGGSLSGVFSRLPDEELAALSLFGFAFAMLAAHLDRDVAAWVAQVRTVTLATVAIEADLAIALALMLATGFAEGAIEPGLQRLLAGSAVLFAAPLAAVAHVLVAQRWLRPVSSREARAPAATRAAS
jgi:hypothetical protein